MTKTIKNSSVFTNPGMIDGGVFDPGNSFNYIDDLVSFSWNGTIYKVDTNSDDNLVGTGDRDMITVNNGNDTVHAGEGDDVIKDLGTGHDTFFGEGGNDRFVMGAGNDHVDGGAGLDTLDYTGINFTVVADTRLGQALADGLDQFTNIENIIGSEWNDTLKGDIGNNVFYGMGGNDTINGGGGRDSLYGGDGNDNVTGNGGLYGGGGDDILTSRNSRPASSGDILYGEAGNDILTGGDTKDKLYGGEGDDKLNGGDGNDIIAGGMGRNILTGGLDRDTFVFENFGSNHVFDRITDFEPKYDKIDLSLIDADLDLAGDQAFVYTNRANRYNDDVINIPGGPELMGGAGRVSSTTENGHTYIYVQTADGLTAADIVLDGEFKLTADNFIL